MSEQDLHRWEGEGGAVAEKPDDPGDAVRDALTAYRSKVIAVILGDINSCPRCNYAGKQPDWRAEMLAEAVMALPLE